MIALAASKRPVTGKPAGWCVDAINTFRVVSRRFTLFAYPESAFPQLSAISEGGSIPGSSTGEADQAERLGLLSLSSTSPSTPRPISAAVAWAQVSEIAANDDFKPYAPHQLISATE
jgi:hypothetical protein